MNRILFEADEIRDGVASFGGVRAAHVRDVLHGEVGQILKTGELDGRVGHGEIVEMDGDVVRVRVAHDEEPLAPWVDLVLAPPRPRVLKRLLPQLAAMGVGRIVLVGAQKVEKDFWGATLLREENYRPLLVDGLMQGAASTAVPQILARRNFRRFASDELDSLFPASRRIVAHPGEGSGEVGKWKSGEVEKWKSGEVGKWKSGEVGKWRSGEVGKWRSGEVGKWRSGEVEELGRMVLAIGPEGGWTDDEVALLESRGFSRYSLGPRILRTDTAAIALLARLSEV